MKSPRMTLQVQLVLRVFLSAVETDRYGLELCEEAGLPAGTIYPIVARLEQAGWLRGQWEDPAEHVHEKRPRRRYYRLTEDGAEQARTALARTYRSRGSTLPGWARPVAEPGGARP